MANEDVKDLVRLEGSTPETNQPEENEGKNNEEKKEFWFIRGAKAAGRGLKKAGKAINNGVHNHPYIAAGIATTIGYGIRMAVEFFSPADSDAASDGIDIPVLELPESDEIESEDEPIEIELPETETMTEE